MLHTGWPPAALYFCVGKRTEKGIDESEKGGILIEVIYGAMAKW